MAQPFNILRPSTWFRRDNQKLANAPQKRGINANTIGNYWGSGTTSANASSALSVSAVWACIDILSKHIASLPFTVYAMDGAGGKREVKGHPARYLVRKMANTYTTAFDFRRAMIATAYFYGNSYTWIERDQYSGRPVALHRALLTHIADIPDGGIVYRLELPSPTGRILRRLTATPDDVIHIKGLTLNGVTGLQLLTIMSDTIGAAQAANEFANKYYTSGAKLNGVVEIPQIIGDTAVKAVAKSVDDYVNEDNSGILILEGGATYRPISGDMQQSSNISARDFSVSDVGRIFGVPLNMLGDNSKSTYNNVEQYNRNFITNTLMPICEQVEAQHDARLLTVADYKYDTAWFEHDFKGLERGDTTAIMKRVETLVKWGVIELDEARVELGYQSDPRRKVYLTPLNMSVNGEDEPPQQEEQIDEPTSVKV